jgi:predicted heme/steroid binding protein
MSQISNLSFDVRFEPHNPDRVGLIDTTPSLPAGYVGIFKVTQPDGYVREGNISTPDVNNVTRSVVVTLVPDSTGSLQQGQYVIEFTALAPGYLSTTFTRTFTFQYTPATVVLRNDFDLFTPSLAYTDISNYNVSGYSITTGPTRRWDVTSPTTGLITGTNSSIDIVYNNNYYAENYAIAFRVNMAYVSQAYPWLSITHTINTTATATACVPKSIEELTQAVDALRIESNQACGDDWSRFEKANALYTHLINMLRLVLVAGEYQEGFYDVYQQLLSLLQNGNTTCATIGQIIPPYDFSDYESSIYDGEASYCTLVGNGVNTVFTINHQLGDKCVVAQVYEVATGKQVICELAVVTINTIDVTFFEPPTTNQYRVVVVAGALGIRGQGLQPGGLDGQVLIKKSDADFDTEWADASSVNPLLVPYIGATGDVDLGEFGLKTGNLEFDTTPTGAPTTAGSAVWNDSDGTLDLVLKGGGTTIQVGQDLVIRAVNKTNANLLKSEYKAVRVRKVSEGGAQGQRLAVVLGQASTEMNSTDMLGIVTENISNNNEGFITTFGTVRGINTTGSLQGETWADGDILFLSPTVPGGITKVKPSAPNHLVIIGYVEYAHQNNGKIFVHVQTSWELDELHNVSISSPVSGQTLVYNQATGLWYNSKLSIEQLSDVFVSSPTPGQILVYTGGGWNNAALPASVTSVGLASSTSGVTITNTPVTGSGVININIATASSSSNGLLSSADWTTFNGKQPFITAGTTAQYYRGDKTFQTLDTSVVPENTNLYFTNARARQAISLTTTGGSGAATYDNSTGIINIPQYTLGSLGGVPSTRTLTINGTAYDLSADRSWSVGTVTSVNMSVPTGFAIGGNPVTSSGTLALSFAAGYSLPTDASQANWNTAYTNRITSLTTNGTSGAATLVSNVLNIPQYQAQGNYITSLTGEATASGPGAASVTLSNSAVTGKVLTGLTVTGTTIAATDSILTAFGKVQGQINSLMGGLKYQGTWNASTNTPALASGTGTEGHFYIVSVAGTTSIDGVNDWKVGDWIVYNGGAWQKVDNTDSVISVNGATGAVVLTTTNISEGTNLYYTNARARLALSLTTTGSSGAATYDNITGVFNIPQYTLAGLGGVPTTRQLTINGTSYDLSADRSWSVGTVTSVAALTIGSTGTDVNSTVSNGTTTPAITLNIPSASTTARGLVTTSAQTFGGDKTFYSNATILDTAGASSQLQGKAAGVLYGGIFFGPFYQFNAYAAATEGYVWKNAATDNVMTLAQTGAFSLKALIGTGTRMVVTDASGLVSTQAIPTGTTTGSGTTNYVTKWTSSSVLGNSSIFDNGNVGIGTTSPQQTFVVSNGGANGFEFDPTNSFISSYNRSTSAWTAVTYRAGSHKFNINNSNDALIIQSNGNVGIGTTTDAGYKLDVSGTLRSTLGANFATTSGNVGIGTASPTERLSILSPSATSAAISFRGNNLSAAEELFVGQGTAGAYFVYGRGNYDMSFATNSSTRMVILSGGNVGIGTSSPVYKLVVSNGGAEGFEFIPAFSSNVNVLQNYNRSTATWGRFDVRANDYIFRNQGTEALVITSTGNVGVGVVSPVAKLQVNTILTSLLGVTGGDAIIAGANVTPSKTQRGNLHVETINSVQAVGVGPSLTFGINASQFGFDYVAVGASIKATITGTSNTDISPALVFSTLDPGGAASVSLTEKMRIGSSGAITITSLSGTGTRMVVADATGVLSTQSISGGVVLGSGTTNYVPKWTSSSGLGNSQIFDDGTNVGIGTATPISGSILDVVGSANVYPRVRSTGTGEAFHFYQNSNSGTTAGDGLFVGINSGNDAFFYNAEATPARFFTSATERLRIFANGRVGINTGATDYGDYRLQVVGAIYNTAGAVLAATSGNVGIGTSSPGAKLEIAYTTNPTTATPHIILTTGGTTKQAAITADSFGVGGLVFSTGDGTLTDRMTILRANGNVGIGTTSPSEKLDVSGTFDVKAIIQSTSTGVNANSTLTFKTATEGTWLLQTGNATSGGFRIYDGVAGLERLRINSAGNVGIGTSNPGSAALRVQGVGSDAVQSALQLSYNTSMTSGVNGVYMSFNNSSEPNSQLARIAAFYEGGTYRGSLRFYTNTNTDGSSPTEQMRIFSTGNVFIGSSPVDNGYRLDVSGNLSVRTGKIDVLANTDFAMNLNRSGTSPVAFQAFTSNAWIIMGAESSSGGNIFTGSSANAAVVGSGYNTPLQFATNNIVRMTVDNAGNVGVGTTSPISKLHVLGGARFESPNTNGVLAEFRNSAPTSLGYVGVEGNTGGVTLSGTLANATLIASGATGTALQFGSAGVIRATITSGGNVGIGTTSPLNYAVADTYLEVSGRSAGGAGVYYASNNGKTVVSHFYSDSLVGSVGTQTNHPFIITTNNTERIRVTSVGNVGIGTTTPQNYSGYKTLEIQDTNGGVLRLTNPAASVSLEVAAAPTETYIKNIVNLPLWFGTNNTERMRITAVGNVGIGGSPLDRFTVIQDQNATSTARVRNSDTGSSAYAMVAVNASGNSWGMRMGSTAANSNALDFVSDALGTPTSRMRITTDGNVGIGTTSPTYQLETIGTASAAANNTATGSSTRFRNIYTRSRANSAGISGDVYADQLFHVSGGAIFELYNADNYALVLGTNALERMRITAGGNLLVATTSDAGPRATIHASGAGSPATSGTSQVGPLRLSNNYNAIVLDFGFDTSSNVWIQAANGQALGSNANMLLNPNGGNVGIGTASPTSAKLQIEGPSGAGGSILFQTARASGFGSTELWQYYVTGGADYGSNFGINVSSATNGRASIVFKGNAVANTGELIFNTTSAERMRITSSGEVLVNTVSDAGDYKLQVNGGIYTNYQMKVAAAQLSIEGYSNGAALYVASHSITGSSNQPVIQADVTLNTTGNVNLLNFDITNTASGASTNWLRFSDGSNTFRVTKGAAVVTAAPTGGSAKPWKLGSVVATTVALNTGNFVEVEIDGTFYRLAIVNPA